MAPNNFYLSFGRHGRYGTDTPILRSDMIAAFLSGKQLQEFLPSCAAIYHSPLARAEQTALFQALGMKCNHLLCVNYLIENATKFEINKFINQLLQNSDDTVSYYHFVTHLPVVEKLGLPFLGAGEICLLSAENKEAMLAEDFSVQLIKKPEISAEIWQKLHLTPPQLESLSAAEIYQKLQSLL